MSIFLTEVRAEPLVITIKQAATMLQVTEKSVRNFIEAGHLKSVKIAGARRIPLDELKRLASEGTQAA
jgi:excisionase family DNA binding protein